MSNPAGQIDEPPMVPDPNVPVLTLAGLTVAMAAKHFVADFLLQTDWMARGKERGRDWALPLAAHAGVHALCTLALALLVRPDLWWLAPADFAVHAAIDRGKALVSLRTHHTTADARFWWLMGFDQFLHQATNVVLAVALCIP